MLMKAHERGQDKNKQSSKKRKLTYFSNKSNLRGFYGKVLMNTYFVGNKFT